MPPAALPAALHPPVPLPFTPYAMWKSHSCIYATTSDNSTSHNHFLLQKHIYVYVKQYIYVAISRAIESC